MSRDRSSRGGSDRSGRPKRWSTLTFVAVVIALLLVAGLSLAIGHFDDTVLSYVKGESLWSKAQKQAVIDLERYARTGEPAAWRGYQEALQIPLGDRQARKALQAEPPDRDRARQGFLQGGLQPGAIDGMIRLFLWLGDWGPMARSIEIWTEADSLIAELQREGRKIRAQWETPPPDSAALNRTLTRIEALNGRLAERERHFTDAIDQASDHARRWSQAAVAGLTVLLLVMVGGVTRKLYREIHEREASLRRSEERYRHLFEHNVSGVFRSSLDGTLLECNQAFAETFGYGSPAELKGLDVQRLYAPDEDRQDYLERLREEGGFVNEELCLERRDGSTIWVLENSTLTEDPETGELVNEGTLIDITDRKRLEDRLRYESFHDPLTGLANRSLLQDRLEQGLARSRRHGEPLGLLMLDIDHFKRVNDELGHTAGDRVLTELARRLKETAREEDTVARWGGDEFVVVLPDLADPEAVTEAWERLREPIRTPIDIEGDSVHVDLTAGAVVHSDRDHPGSVQARNPEELIRLGSLALHWSKEDKPGGFSVFDPGEQVEEGITIRREKELRDALERGEIVPHYQPIVRLDDRGRESVEALARWQHPEEGTLGPAEFIPLAEKLGLIGPVQEAIVHQGCRDQGAREETSEAGTPLEIRFNISGRQFRDPTLAEDLERVVREAGARPEQVIVEVTETSLMQVPATVDALRGAGFEVSIDDFGTGYSTFTYLRDLEVDELKIDMTFIQGLVDSPSDFALVDTMLTLGDRLGLRVVAEGIETEAQLRKLRSIGCIFGQGYLFGRPGPLEEMA